MGTARVDIDDATEVDIIISNKSISLDTHGGYVGGAELVVEYTGDLDVRFANNYIADFVAHDDNTAHILMVSDKGIKDVLDVVSGNITSIL